jgi:hypothetical protein
MEKPKQPTMDTATKPEPNRQDVENRSPTLGKVNVETLKRGSWNIRRGVIKYAKELIIMMEK